MGGGRAGARALDARLGSTLESPVPMLGWLAPLGVALLLHPSASPWLLSHNPLTNRQRDECHTARRRPHTRCTLRASQQIPQTNQFRNALHRALHDKRFVDELVALFEYNSKLKFQNSDLTCHGQGQIKRFFANDLLHDVDPADASLKLNDDQKSLTLLPGKNQAQIILEPEFAQNSGLVTQVIIQGHDHGRTAKLAKHASGPLWETYDGRVRQRIWQEANLLDKGNTFIKEKLQITSGRIIVIVDQTVWRLYGGKINEWAASVDLQLDPVVAPGNEDKKTLQTFTYLLDELKRVDPLRRSEPVLAIGGGVLTDTVGFACACWRRGIPWCRMPTTLLGMVDASVGIKVAINYHRKNGVGHFYSPLHTFIDSSFLASLPVAEIRSGVGEIMKAALIHDVRLWNLIRDHGERLIRERFMDSVEASQVIKLSVDAMLECIGPDLWEEALVRPMDFGHSFSRTLEADERFQLRHGEAVAIDCIFSSLIAEQKGLLSRANMDGLLDLYVRLGLPCSIKGITAKTYKRARDEIVVHRDGLLRAPLPHGIGQCEYATAMSDEEIEGAFARLEAFIHEHPSACWDPSLSFNAPISKVGSQ